MDQETNYMVISPKDPSVLATFAEVITEIEFSLAELKMLASSLDFTKKENKQRYYDNIVHLKRFYERAERIALDAKNN